MPSSPYTKATILSVLSSLQYQAVKAGVMTKDQKLLYDASVPAVWVDREGGSCPFLPIFERLTRKEQYHTIQGAIFALMAVNNR